MATITRKPRTGDAGPPENVRATASSNGGARSTPKSPTRLAVYDGRQFVGFLLTRNPLGVEAFDINEHSLGIFPDLKTAADAVSRAMGSGA